MRRTFASLSVLVLVACGGSDAPTQAPPVDQSPTLDFTAIAGAWAGWGGEFFPDGSVRTSWMVIDLDDNAQAGKQVGTFTVGVEGPDGELVQDCSLSLIAEAADPPTYTFTVTHPTCTDATLDVNHDVDAGVLLIDVTAVGDAFTASHILEPGSDPGPAP